MIKLIDYDGDAPINGLDTRQKNAAITGYSGSCVRGNVTQIGATNTYQVEAGTVVFVGGFTAIFKESEEVDMTNGAYLALEISEVSGTYSASVYVSDTNDSDSTHLAFYKKNEGMINRLYEQSEIISMIPVIRYGTAAPDNSVGKDGDIYIKIVE